MLIKYPSNYSVSTLNLAEQQIIDCSSTAPYVNFGCSGGTMQMTYAYMKAHQIRAEAAYPYKAVQTTCQYSTTSTTGSVSAASSSYGPYTLTDPESIKAQVYSNPVVIAIAVANSFYYYSSGIYAATDCSNTALNHAVQIVGWGSTTVSGVDTPYWIMKNQWGTYWGESGYMRIAMQSGNGVCQMNEQISYPKA